MSSISDYLKEYNIKPSLQRIAIMDYLKGHKTHPTVDEIYNALAPSIPTLSRTTVYNTLKLFVEKGAALFLSIEEKNVRFDGDITPHAHFICQGCKAVYDIHATEVRDFRLKDTEDFSIKEIQIYCKGLCKHCTQKKIKNN